MNDRHVTTESLDDLEYVGCQKDSRASGDHPLKHGLQSSCGYSIDALEGLVQKENLGTVDHRSSHRQLLLHAMGVIRYKFFRLIGELHELEKFCGTFGRGVSVEAVHASG